MDVQQKPTFCDHIFHPWMFGQVTDGYSIKRIPLQPNSTKAPLQWNEDAGEFPIEGKRRLVFCSEDWLRNGIPSEWIAYLLKLIKNTPNLDWLLCSFHLNRWRHQMEDLCRDSSSNGEFASFVGSWLKGIAPENIWMGAGFKCQYSYDLNAFDLLSLPVKNKFLYCKNLDGFIDLSLPNNDTCGKVGVRYNGLGNKVGEICGHSMGESRDECSTVFPKSFKFLVCEDAVLPGAGRQFSDFVDDLKSQCETYGIPYHSI